MSPDSTQGIPHASTAPAEPPLLSSGQLRSILEQGSAWTILDVRPSEERAEWFIPGSVHVDAYNALKTGDASALLNLGLPRPGPIVTVCAMGRTSAVAARILREHGYDAYSLAGGMKDWSLAWNSAEVSSPEATLVQLRRTGKG